MNNILTCKINGCTYRGKNALVVHLMARERGATREELRHAVGWTQPFGVAWTRRLLSRAGLRLAVAGDTFRVRLAPEGIPR